MTLVLDASAALAWIYYRRDPVEHDRAARLLLQIGDQQTIVPEFWHLEVLNGLVTGQRRGVITVSTATEFLARLGALPIETSPWPVSERKTEIFALAGQ